MIRELKPLEGRGRRNLQEALEQDEKPMGNRDDRVVIGQAGILDTARLEGRKEHRALPGKAAGGCAE
jgi:hypothetical protein